MQANTVGGSEGSVSANDDGISPSALLCDALYDMAESAAIVVTSNQDLLKAFIQACDEAKRHALLAGAGAGMSFTIATAALGAVLEESAVVAASAEVMVMPGLAAAAGVIGSIYCIVKATKKVREIKHFNKRIVYHERSTFLSISSRHIGPKNTGANVIPTITVRDFILQSWQLAADTERFLQWVHSTNMARPTPIDAVNDETKQDWQQFLDTIQQAVGDFTVTTEVVKAYLEIRRKTLKQIRKAVDEADRKAFPNGH